MDGGEVQKMTLRLTPDLLRAGYDLLSITRPFDRWNLPDDVTFRVARTRQDHGWFRADGGKLLIVASSGTTGHLHTLFGTLAHEMVHLHQHLTGMPVNHGPTFRKLADEVCRWHRDFDPKSF
jgi:hypothetical protein